MKIKMTSVAVLLAGLFASTAADAACTNNPFRMGWDAANQACQDIARGYMPMPWGHMRLASGGHESLPDPERTCTAQDVIQCKNAAAQYIRRFQSSGCANLIRRDVSLTSAAGGAGTSAAQVWRNYVTITCNLP